MSRFEEKTGPGLGPKFEARAALAEKLKVYELTVLRGQTTFPIASCDCWAEKKLVKMARIFWPIWYENTLPFKTIQGQYVFFNT